MDGQTSANDNEHSGLPLTSAVPEYCENTIVPKLRQTINDVCAFVGMLYELMQQILSNNLCMRCIAAKVLLGLLSYNHKELNVHVGLKIAVRVEPNFFCIPQNKVKI